ncbi:MAG TPA: hypothetical protein VFE53_14460 [Mucilaginibacter sp.]|jgi:hypothetical protein|nr:hypothetical protein [Mucilaginibacter sp.]
MKYAYIIGSNAFVVPSKVVGYTDNGQEKEFLRINSVYHNDHPGAGQPTLECDINISDTNGTPVTLVANKLANAPLYSVVLEYDSVMVRRPDGSTVIHIHQLDQDSAMQLEPYITAELEVNVPVAAIRIFGDFKLGSLHILAENEKLFINGDGWGNSVKGGLNQLKFTEEGVVL